MSETKGENSKESRFQPKPEQLALVPGISGSEINGLNEAERRRPRYIYWHDPSKIAHGPLQQWFYAQNSSPQAAEARKQAYANAAKQLPPIAITKAGKTPEEWATMIKEVAREAGAEDIGITILNQEHVYEGVTLTYRWIIIIAVSMEYEQLKKAPSIDTSVEVMTKYAAATSAAFDVAAWVRKQGWDAYSHGGPAAGPVLLIPHAIKAGIGQLGKHGSMIHRTFGSSFRLACVVTDLPLIEDSEDEFGSEEFCLKCRVCTKACPAEAITDDKHLVRGENKWYTNFDKCILYFNENMSCGVCIASCPWTRPGMADNLLSNIARKRALRKKK